MARKRRRHTNKRTARKRRRRHAIWLAVLFNIDIRPIGRVYPTT